MTPAPQQQHSHAPHPWVVTTLELVAVRALKRSGNWLLNRQVRRYDRPRMQQVPLHLMHTRLPVPADRVDEMLHGAWDEMQLILPDQPCMHELVREYVTALLLAGHAHDRTYLETQLARSECLDAEAAA